MKFSLQSVISTILVVGAVLGFAFGMTTLTNNRQERRMNEAEARCAAYAAALDGRDFTVEEDRQWGTDDWVCTFTTDEGIEQIRWPE